MPFYGLIKPPALSVVHECGKDLMLTLLSLFYPKTLIESSSEFHDSNSLNRPTFLKIGAG